jgi:hypothetical protein
VKTPYASICLALVCTLSSGCSLDFSGFKYKPKAADAAVDDEMDVDVDVEEMPPPDGTPAQECGNGLVEQGEACDYANGEGCPATCNPISDCDRPLLQGTADDCSAVCIRRTITAAIQQDGCCPDGATFSEDGDCDCVGDDCDPEPLEPPAPSAECGNGALDDGETCDPAGTCAEPEDCVSPSACTAAVYVGTAETCDAECRFEDVTTCQGGDVCCPAGCDSSNDSDCPAERLCGNGEVDDGETCDGDDCPVSCETDAACMAARLVGSVADCTAECIMDPVVACQSDDGCCPAGCNSSTDNDCDPLCGNGVQEGDELCDGNCPTSCEDDGDACTLEDFTGTEGTCDVQCSNIPVGANTEGDGCCLPGANNVDDTDCAPVCGNGVIESGENCEPGSETPCVCEGSDVTCMDSCPIVEFLRRPSR